MALHVFLFMLVFFLILYWLLGTSVRKKPLQER
jgi:hypothetical protein